MRGAVGVALQRDSGYTDGWPRRQSFFQVVKLRLSSDQAKSPAVIVDDDIYMVRIVEGRRAAGERFIIEFPFGRSNLPNQLANSLLYLE